MALSSPPRTGKPGICILPLLRRLTGGDEPRDRAGVTGHSEGESVMCGARMKTRSLGIGLDRRRRIVVILLFGFLASPAWAGETDADRAKREPTAKPVELQPRDPADPRRQVLPVPRSRRTTSARGSSGSTARRDATAPAASGSPAIVPGQARRERAVLPDHAGRARRPHAARQAARKPARPTRSSSSSSGSSKGPTTSEHWAFIPPVRPAVPTVSNPLVPQPDRPLRPGPAREARAGAVARGRPGRR